MTDRFTDLPRKAFEKVAGLSTSFVSESLQAVRAVNEMERGNNKPAQNNEHDKKPDKYEQKLKEQLAESEKKHGKNSVEVAGNLLDLAGYYRVKNMSDKAVPLYERYLQIEQLRGDSSISQAQTCDSIAATLKECGRTKEASQWEASAQAFRRDEKMKNRLADSEKKHGGNSVEVARDLLPYAAHLRQTDRSLEAVPLLERRLQIEQKRGDSSLEQAWTCDLIAASFKEGGRTKEASQWTARAKALRKKDKSE